MTLPAKFFERPTGCIEIATPEPYGDVGFFLTTEATHSQSRWLNEFLAILEQWDPNSSSTYAGTGEIWFVQIRGELISLIGQPEFLPEHGVTVSIADFLKVAKMWKAKLLEHESK
ncbi:hypothetical protein [Gemmata sp. SH-PL17]|uniref:hypothetical protein n=1 Tax=Gemmata sp. SH-PL17 TaxID=1630693 RepID=UPI0012FC0295|nr:hypothetical protein [Gemmata sp. SH-PL17]